MKDYDIKLERVLALVNKNGYDAAVIGRRDNFAWFTGGEESGVVFNQEKGFVYLVITKDKKLAVSMCADGRKAQEEQLLGCGFESVELNWKSESVEGFVENLLAGKRFLSDVRLKGATQDLEAFYELEYPMTKTEIDRYRGLGKITEDILGVVAKQIQKGMTENELKAVLLGECAARGVDVDVLLIGSDERICRYRHCTPTDKKIEKTILISPVFRRQGLHSNIARMVSIGKPKPEVRKAYDTVCQIQAEVIGRSGEGILFREIFELQEELYRKLGYEDEWLLHGHGAPVGYMLSDGNVLHSAVRKMHENQAYEWYVTVSGAKSAELVMNIGNQQEILSLTGKWPVKSYEISTGKNIELPDILVI